MKTTNRLSWGILGTGNIAGQFATGLRNSERSVLAAVGSRQLGTAEDFARTHQAARAWGSYEGALTDPAVQAVYVSLPNSMHHEWTIKALRAGKHVLCEKPLATRLSQAEEMFAEAKRAGRVLAEAFMYRSHPQTLAVQKAVGDGRIGALRMIRTSFVFSASKMAGNVRFDASLAGGSLMDVGCYCVSYSRLFAGAEPTSLAACGHLHASGVDDYAAGIMKFPGDIVANFTCGITVRGDNTAHLLGTDGHIEIPIPWKPPVTDAAYTIVDAAGNRETLHVSGNKHLYTIEADDFAATVLDGAPQRVTAADSLGNQRCLDELRRQVGVVV